MNWVKDIKIFLCWLGGIGLTVLGFILAEGWIILVVKIFGFAMSTLILALVFLLLSWIVVYFSSGLRGMGRFRDWIKRKEASLSGRAQAVVKGGEALAVVNMAALMGPIFSAILMMALGFDRKKVYIYSIFCALLWAVIWCGIYSGMFWGIHKMSAGRL